MISERGNRTFICSVLFLDIVEYSRKPVAEQIHLKDQFNALIAESIQDIAADDRIILDTGDGVAVNFLGDPEDALFVAMSLRDSFAPKPDEPPKVPARIGINLGPVRLVKDLNGQPNIIGDGINVAQRVMSFAQPGQVLVSRSYYEVVSHISEGYGQLFHYEGSRTDKHVREHEVYSVGFTATRSALKSPAERDKASNVDRRRQSATASAATGTFFGKIESWLNNRSIAYGTATFSVGAFALALMLNFVGSQPKAAESPPGTQRTATNAKKPSVVALHADAKDLAVFGFPQTPEKNPPQVGASAKPKTKRTTTQPLVGEKPQSAEQVDNRSTAQLSPDGADSAMIALAIAPWGEVYVDGNRIGVSPPVNEVEVSPGRRKIEIRNGSFPVYNQVVELKADQKIRIKHKFN
jgi:hypothetical protein